MSDLLPGLHAAQNIHPFFVHAPIALWPVALLFWALALWRRRDDLFAVGRWLLYLGTLGAFLAVGTGFLAAEQLGHDSPGHELVHGHRDYMLVTTALAIAVTFTAYLTRKRNTRNVQWWLVLTLAAVNAVAGLGADRGAMLVFGYGVGTSAAEKPATTAHGHNGDHHGAATPVAPPPSQSRETSDAVQPHGRQGDDGHDHAH